MLIRNYIEKLKQHQLFPGNIQISSWKDWNIVSCFDGISSTYISESVSMGIDKNQEVALAKALTEFCERKLIKESTDPSAKLTTRSDGFAAFPIVDIPKSEAQLRAGANALSEAIERSAWATWWDDHETLYEVRSGKNLPEFQALSREFDLIDLQVVVVPCAFQQKLTIMIAFNRSGGVTTGGAAGSDFNSEGTMARAFGEMLRHLIVVNKMVVLGSQNMSFYERRLFGFASGEWRELVGNRLNKTGDKIVSFADLICDCEISHDHSDLIVIHRCLFRDQPIFMGGELERLCI